MRSCVGECAQFRDQQQFLAREDQVAPGQGVRQGGCRIGDEQHVAAVAFGARMARMPDFRRARGQFGGEFRLEAGAAVAEQAGHAVLMSGFSREACRSRRQASRLGRMLKAWPHQ